MTKCFRSTEGGKPLIIVSYCNWCGVSDYITKEMAMDLGHDIEKLNNNWLHILVQMGKRFVSKFQQIVKSNQTSYLITFDHAYNHRRHVFLDDELEFIGEIGISLNSDRRGFPVSYASGKTLSWEYDRIIQKDWSNFKIMIDIIPMPIFNLIENLKNDLKKKGMASSLNEILKIIEQMTRWGLIIGARFYDDKTYVKLNETMVYKLFDHSINN